MLHSGCFQIDDQNSEKLFILERFGDVFTCSGNRNLVFEA